MHFQSFSLLIDIGAQKEPSHGPPDTQKQQHMMAQLRNVAILVVVVVAAVLLQSTEAKDYEVGGATGWTSFPPGGASFYSKWAANFTFKLNDTLGKISAYNKTTLIISLVNS